MVVTSDKWLDETEGLTKSQMEVYASELRQHYQAERQLRGDLEQNNKQLEQRVKELEALNQLFRRYLEERQLIVHEYQNLRGALTRLESEFSKLLEYANAQELPDLGKAVPSVETG